MKIKRNGPCPCGSGEKYKKCCGGPEVRKVGNSLPPDQGKFSLEYNKPKENIQSISSGKDESAEGYYRQAISMINCNKLEEAKILFEKALVLQPDFFAAHLASARLYHQQNQFEKAKYAYMQALSIDPADVEAQVNLGIICRSEGRLDEAIACFNMALALDPDDAEIFILAYANQKITPDALGQLERIEKKYAAGQLSEKLRIKLAFAIGRCFEELSNYDEAFRYFEEGNRLQRKTFQYSTQWFVDEINNIKKHENFFMSKPSVFESSAPTPVFILGMPRSGTTLVEQILASHPDVFGAGEITEIGDIIIKLTGSNDLATIYENFQRNYKELSGSFAAEYIESLQKYPPPFRMLTNKMPLNYLFVGLIHLAMPNAKIIHCRRDAVDTCWSIFKHFFGGTHKYAYDLRELGEYYLLYQDLMAFWHKVFPGVIYDINYEELVENQELQTRKLLEHCNLTWDEGCLTFYKNARVVETASLAQVNKPIYKSAIQFWRNYERQLQPLLEVLNR